MPVIILAQSAGKYEEDWLQTSTELKSWIKKDDLSAKHSQITKVA